MFPFYSKYVLQYVCFEPLGNIWSKIIFNGFMANWWYFSAATMWNVYKAQLPSLCINTQRTLVWSVASLHYCLIAHAVDTLIALLTILKVYDLICIPIWPCFALSSESPHSTTYIMCIILINLQNEKKSQMICTSLFFKSPKPLLGRIYIAKSCITSKLWCYSLMIGKDVPHFLYFSFK